jgi:hypothetical protein
MPLTGLLAYALALLGKAIDGPTEKKDRPKYRLPQNEPKTEMVLSTSRGGFQKNRVITY